MEADDESTGLLSYVVYGVAIFGIFYFIRRYVKGPQFSERVSAKGKVVVVTGANCGIGFETVKELNIKKAKVYLLCRNEDRSFEARKDLVKLGCDVSRLVPIKCDLSSFDSIRSAAKELLKEEDHIDILINNAGIYVSKYGKTVDGHEETWQTNHLGPFLLTELLLPAIKKSEAGRIVNVSSRLQERASRINLSMIDEKKYFGSLSAYSQSKLANTMHARALSHRLRKEGTHNVVVNSLHPGGVDTEIMRNTIFDKPGVKHVLSPLRWFFMKTARDGAQTTLYVALSKHVEGVSGKYFSDCKLAEESPLALDNQLCDDLYNYSLEQTGLA